MLSGTAVFLLKGNYRPSGSVSGSQTDEAEHEKAVRDHGAILCRACGHVITHENNRLAVEGSHRHTFANPHGLVFEIGCFEQARGCTYEGALTPEFSWFAGFQWKIAVCGACLIHLGWQFVSSSYRFDGLIIDRLISRVS